MCLPGYYQSANDLIVTRALGHHEATGRLPVTGREHCLPYFYCLSMPILLLQDLSTLWIMSHF